MAKIVTVSETQEYLKIAAGTDDIVLQKIVDGLEDLLERESGQTFHSAGSVVDEPYEGTGTARLYLNRPILAVTSIKLGVDKLDTLDVQYVMYEVGKRRLYRTDGNFPEGPFRVWVSYNYAENKPTAARNAILEVAAMVYRRRGSEDARSETLGPFSHSLAQAAEESVQWSKAMELLHRPLLG